MIHEMTRFLSDLKNLKPGCLYQKKNLKITERRESKLRGTSRYFTGFQRNQCKLKHTNFLSQNTAAGAPSLREKACRERSKSTLGQVLYRCNGGARCEYRSVSQPTCNYWGRYITHYIMISIYVSCFNNC